MSSFIEHRSLISSKASWKPGILRRIPIGAFISFIISLICLFSCIAILKLSDRQQIESWPTSKYQIQPSVLLSICTAIANLAIRSMFDAGLTISWWKKALKGSTVGELHRSWEFGTSLFQIIKSVKHFNFIVLASVFVTLVSIDGPLLQRASKVATESWFNATMITANMSPNISMVEHFTGYTNSRAANPSMLSAEFLSIVQNYSANLPIALSYKGCTGVCTTELIGLGLDVQCNTSSQPLIISNIAATTTEVLNFAFGFNGLAEPGTITLRTTLRTTSAPDQLTNNSCALRLARVRHSVRLANGTAQLLPPTMSENKTINLEPLPRERTGMGMRPTLLGGLYLIASRKWGGEASFYVNGSPYELFTKGETPIVYLQISASMQDYTWIDPTNIFISSLQELLFRTTIAASNKNLSQRVSASERSQRTIYVSNYNYLAAALVLMLLAILATSVNLSGWWRLGRECTLGPFEVGKAFNAPFLEDTNYLGTTEEGFKTITNRGIRYGELVGSGDSDSGFGISGAETSEVSIIEQDVELLRYRGNRGRALIGMGSLSSTRSLQRR